MQDFVTRANIARFSNLIAGETDEARRRLLEQMLDSEKAKLDGLGLAHLASAVTSEDDAPAADSRSKPICPADPAAD
jgi:hypothetical protein